MMPKYRIPEQFTSGFLSLSTMSTSTVENIAQIISQVKIGETSSEIIPLIKNKVDINEHQLKEVLETLFSVVNLYNDNNDIDILVGGLTDAFLESQDKNEDDTRLRLYQNLKTFLTQSTNIRLRLKANSLLGEYDKILIDNRIITDIRIVFNESLNDENQSAVVVHQLKIEFQNNGNLKDAFYAMDNNDLIKLKVSIERALEKESKIRSGLYSKSLSFIELSTK